MAQDLGTRLAGNADLVLRAPGVARAFLPASIVQAERPVQIGRTAPPGNGVARLEVDP